MREGQTKFRLRQGCVDQIVTFYQILEHCHTYRWPSIVYNVYQGALDSVDGSKFSESTELRGVPTKDFTVSYLAADDYGEQFYLPLQSDWDLDAAILTSSDPALRIKIMVKKVSSGKYIL
ncbi:uncharacterized protein DEA37_0012168 [Paragonimus westermani]|uniref:Uncharacterized protein n=1 Tax=Paragonimus westermani TaxID=34504 RepID=A0A5J4NM24_9TREM|nr:uncharacterized protein DEA37_0012168 [Paragonimus westermani]